LACNLALGLGLVPAVQQAKDYVAQAIASADSVGHGTGPLNHLWNMTLKK
jgi:hydroxymethylpyrimidine/phosphomethylpyrimidine kinase